MAPLRARINGQEVTLGEERGGRTEVIARFGLDFIIAGEVADDRFDRVVTREVALQRAPAGPAVAGVMIEPGVVVERALAIHTSPPIEVAGFVPPAATGRHWDLRDERADGRTRAAHQLPSSGEVFDGPAAVEPIAEIRGDDAVVDVLEDGPPGWNRVEAHDASVRVVGFITVQRPSMFAGQYDFSDDTVEGELVVPAGRREIVAGPGCLRARPDDGAAIVGVASAPVRSRRVLGRWVELRLAAPWGTVVGYLRR
jgi:hypothetical protein